MTYGSEYVSHYLYAAQRDTPPQQVPRTTYVAYTAEKLTTRRLVNERSRKEGKRKTDVETDVEHCKMIPCTLADGTSKQVKKGKRKLYRRKTAITHRPPKINTPKIASTYAIPMHPSFVY